MRAARPREEERRAGAAPVRDPDIRRDRPSRWPAPGRRVRISPDTARFEKAISCTWRWNGPCSPLLALPSPSLPHELFVSLFSHFGETARAVVARELPLPASKMVVRSVSSDLSQLVPTQYL